jgi:Rieske Fe-S protein
MKDHGADGSREAEEQTTPPDGRPNSEQPKWRKDFPIDWGQDEYVSRRDLAKYMVLTSAAFATGQLFITYKARQARTTAAPTDHAIATLDELPVGGAKTFTYPEGSTPRLLVRMSEDEFVAYDQQCTHLLCPVVPAVEEGKIHCPCHNGWFDLETGHPLAGPPRRPLQRIMLELRGNTLYATGVEEPST